MTFKLLDYQTFFFIKLFKLDYFHYFYYFYFSLYHIYLSKLFSLHKRVLKNFFYEVFIEQSLSVLRI